ncbi:MAG: hydratase [Acidimicrobiia bacterium]|nr:hydratase [Acidimicrobiia bacterium]MDH4306407.1 hydratase [Acidimicrobiia bacterium]MDH5293595.1 hydratase [Acidimicrobiia bacterium]
MTHDVGIAIAQISSEPFEVELNRARCDHAIRQAFSQAADIVILPELIVHGYVADARRLAPIAETVPGPTTSAWQSVAAEAGGYVVGGLAEIEGERLYNTAVAVGPQGVVAHYRKAHLFAEEKIAFAPGDLGFPVARTRFGTIGLCVCYDLRFVEVVRVMALRGADLICVPTAWLPGFDQARWDAEGMSPQGRGAELQANLNQVFIGAASQAGVHGSCDFLGSSILIDPYGKRVVGPLSGDRDEVVVARVDIGASKRAQVRGDLIAPRADRRTDVYGLAYNGEVL